jgi:hypothetical protein
MKRLAIATFACFRATATHKRRRFQPASTNVWGAEYPRVDASGRAEFRIKAPNATAVKLNFWSNPKLDMVKGSDGFWTATTPPLVPRIPLLQLRHRRSGRERCGEPCLLRRRQRRKRHRDSRTWRNLLSAARCSARRRARDLVFLQGHRELAARRSLSAAGLRHAEQRRAIPCFIFSTAAAKTRRAGSSRAMPTSSSTT